MITREQIARLRELDEKMGPSIWTYDYIMEHGGFSEQSAHFIAESRNILPALLRDLEKLLAVYEAAKYVMNPNVDDPDHSLFVMANALKACEEGE